MLIKKAAHQCSGTLDASVPVPALEPEADLDDMIARIGGGKGLKRKERDGEEQSERDDAGKERGDEVQSERDDAMKEDVDEEQSERDARKERGDEEQSDF